MKKYSVIAAALLWSTLAACKNPYIIHNLERPVYLHNIEIRSDIIGDADPSHPLDEAFQRDRRNYTATVPAPVTRVTIIGHPEEGAEVAVSGGATQLFPGKELTVTLTVRKQYRTDTVYTVRIVKGLPEASIQGLALYVDIPAPVNNSQRLDDYEPDNYVSNFLFSRGNYEVKVPEYTNDLAIVVRSFIHAPISEVWYEFKDHAGNTIGSTGRIPAPGYKAPGMPADIAPASLPAWWENPAAPVHGDIRFYPGGGPSEAASTWFGKGLVDSSDPNPLGKGKAAEIHITVKAPNLGDKTYVLKLTREPGSTYLGGITVQQIEQSGGSVVITGGTVQAPAAVVSGNRLVGSFAGTVTDYDARLSPAARALRIELT
ncbi:MAG: cadherin-like beta sandwich domain-containing protein, partial [Treponema sp.]|nr:cadherin-like beta sandwich domain-containing protein [Treponema sp.]